MKRVPYRSYLTSDADLAESRFRGAAAVLVMVVVGSAFAAGLWFALISALMPIFVMLIVVSIAPFPAAALAMLVSESGRRDAKYLWLTRLAAGLACWGAILAVLIASEFRWERIHDVGDALGLAFISGIGGGFAAAFSVPSTFLGALAGRAIASHGVRNRLTRDRQARWPGSDGGLQWKA